MLKCIEEFSGGAGFNTKLIFFIKKVKLKTIKNPQAIIIINPPIKKNKFINNIINLAYPTKLKSYKSPFTVFRKSAIKLAAV